MIITGNIVTFKSKGEYYEKEFDGRKSNTVRIVNKFENALLEEAELGYIKIINIETDDIFYRKLTDITRFIHNDIIIYIFSWCTFDNNT